MRFHNYLATAVVLLIMGTITLSGQVKKSGVLRSNETWEGVIRVTGDVVVPEGVTLTIKPNALIKFEAGNDDQEGGYDVTRCELIIEGVLKAEGKEKYEIRFTSSNFLLPAEQVKATVKTQPQAGDWYGIVFMKGNNDRSIITYSVIEFAYDGITCVNASPRIFRNRIESNYWNGILCDIISNPKINNNQIINNGYAGINVKINSAPSINGNEITSNRFGILIQDVSRPNIGNIQIGEQTGRNAIYGNLEYNLYNHTKNVIYAQRNDWGDNTNADRMIKDDDENAKYGLVVYTPVYASGKISYLEYQSLAAGGTTAAKEDKEKKQKEIEELKKRIEEAKKQQVETKTGGPALEDKSKEEQERLFAEQKKEQERLRLLEEELKLQEQIRIEQEKQMALKKKEEEERKRVEEEQRKKAALEKKETAVASGFVPVKMANELDRTPKVISKVTPTLPKEAAQARVSGTISLRVLVGTDGKAKEIHIAKRIGNKDFDQMIEEEAKATVKKWVFEVGLFEGKPVEYWTVVTMLFK